MAQHIFVLTSPDLKIIADDISKQIFVNGIYESEDMILTTEILEKIIQNCPVDYFYVITANEEINFDKFDFSFKPKEWDKEYMHIWNNKKVVRLFNKTVVQKNPSLFTDEALLAGTIKLKNIESTVYKYPAYDIVFLSYDEYNAKEQFKKLKTRFPRAIHVSGVKGILEAHKAAARAASTNMVYIVDADAEILPTFNFDYQLSLYERETVHIWHSINPINFLEYGYGGVKLFPSSLMLEYKGSPIDFTTGISDSIKVHTQVSNITRFNTDPFSTWRSAFRECVKLSSKIVNNQDNDETESRLNTWCTVGREEEFGEFAIMGANEGKDFGSTNIKNHEQLKLINDFNWLEQKFNS